MTAPDREPTRSESTSRSSLDLSRERASVESLHVAFADRLERCAHEHLDKRMLSFARQPRELGTRLRIRRDRRNEHEYAMLREQPRDIGDAMHVGIANRTREA